MLNWVAMVREKYLENEIFSRSGKIQGICGWPGKFRKTWKVREFENKWLWQTIFRKSREERMYILMRYLSPLPSSMGATLKGKGANSFL